MKKNIRESGVSLVEILIVVAVIAFVVSLFIHRPVALKNTCIGNLQQISRAKAIFAHASEKTNGYMVRTNDICGPDCFLPQMPVCPAGGVYRIGRVGEQPLCSIAGHSLSKKETQ